MGKTNGFDSYGGNLRFDNLNFKLAVLQHLIFEKKVFSPKYDFGNIDDIAYEEDYSMEQYEEALEAYKQEALQYFTYLKVPAELAKYVTHLEIDAGDDIYFEINPAWDGEDDCFFVDRISDREVAQFPKLKRISSWYMSNNVPGLAVQMKKHRIKVEVKENHSNEKYVGNLSGTGKRISPVAALLCILVVTLVTGGVSAKIFHNLYNQVEVTWTESETDYEEKNDTSSFNTEEIEVLNQDTDESLKKLKEKMKEVTEQIENGSGSINVE